MMIKLLMKAGRTRLLRGAKHKIKPDRMWGRFLSLALRWGRRLTRPDVFFYCGLWMMVLLMAGTISQKYIGLYQARLKFFSSFLFWFYGLPLPGGRMAMGLILISLVLKTIYSLSPLKNKKKLGSFVMHLGVILLLTGAFITGVFSQEGYMTLAEGESSSVVLDYHKVELSIEVASREAGSAMEAEDTKPSIIKSKTRKAFYEQSLIKNQILTGPFPFSIRVQEFMKNAEPVFSAKQEASSSMPDLVTLKPKKREKVNEENQAGLLFQIIIHKKNQNQQDKNQGIKNYALFEPLPQTVMIQGQKYIIRLRPIRTYLPFFLKLIHFKKEHYPGSDKAKSYQSLVYVGDRGTKQRRLIKMNRPLRYKGYTFYQSSYIEGAEKESSVLAVVKNAGRAFPYVSSLIICFGLLVYMFSGLLSSPKRKK